MPDLLRRVAVAFRRVAAAFLLLAGLGLAIPLPQPAEAADPARAAHGSADVFTAPGVALAWGILRGASEASTLVVLQIVAERDVFATATVVGIDPFAQKEQVLLPLTPVSARIELRVPRAQFADHPRTELRLYGSAGATPADAPKLVVFYLGVPDTTPEFASEAALESYLAQRIAGARSNTGSRRP